MHKNEIDYDIIVETDYKMATNRIVSVIDYIDLRLINFT